MNKREKLYAEGLAKLIQQKTVSKYYEKDFTRFLDFHKVLKEMFPNVFSKCEINVFGGSLLIKWKGKCSDNPIMFMNHHDVVDGEGEWKYPPFSGKIAEGKVWGRGALDTKSGLYCMLQSAEELLNNDFVPNSDIYFVSSCTEEVEGSGAEQISNYLIENKIRFTTVYDEGGMIVDDPLGVCYGKFAMIGIAEKGCHVLKFTAKSFGGHASAPPKNLPVVRLGRFMADVDDSKQFTSLVTPCTCEMLKRFSFRMKGIKKFVFSHAKAIKPILKVVMPKLSATANAMLKTTVAFTMTSASGTWNAIPQEANVIADMRFSHHQGSEKSLDVVKKIASKYGVEVEIIDRGIESGITDYKGESFKKLENAISKHFKDIIAVPYISNTAADIRYMSKVCDNCIRFTPFIISDEQLSSIHANNENIDISCLPIAVDFYKTLMGE